MEGQISSLILFEGCVLPTLEEEWVVLVDKTVTPILGRMVVQGVRTCGSGRSLW